MLRRALVFVALGLTLWPGSTLADPAIRDPARVPAGAYVLDTRQSSLMIRIPLMGGFSRYRMRFNKLTGSFDYDPASWQSTQVEIIVDPRAVEAENTMFNRAIVGYFEPDKYPVIRFRSTALVADPGGRGKLSGDLTFHGVTRPITLDVQFNGFGPDPQGAGARMAFSGTGTIRRSEFGVIAGRLFADDRIDLIFEVEFARK
jgi:polyisoprenoid-binding protein YceI